MDIIPYADIKPAVTRTVSRCRSQIMIAVESLLAAHIEPHGPVSISRLTAACSPLLS